VIVTNIDKMLKKQEEINSKLAKVQPIREEENTVAYYNKPKHTHTNIVYHNDSIMLTRYMWNNIYKVVFAKDVKVVDILEYMDIDDGLFTKCSVRYGV